MGQNDLKKKRGYFCHLVLFNEDFHGNGGQTQTPLLWILNLK